MILEIYFTRPRHLHIGATRRKELTLSNFISQICQYLLQFRMSSSSNKRGHKKHLYVPKQYELMPPKFGHKMAREIAVRVSKQDKIKFTAKKKQSVSVSWTRIDCFQFFSLGITVLQVNLKLSAGFSTIIWRNSCKKTFLSMYF